MDFKKQCAIFIDIDGTLMGSSSCALEQNLKTINHIRSLGHKVFISTGRSTSYVPSEIALKDNFDGFIAGSGAHVMHGDIELAKQLVPYTIVRKVCDYFLRHNIPGILEGEKDMYYFSDISYKKSGWIPLDKKTALELINEDTPIQKFSIYGIAPKDLAAFLGENCTVLQHNGYAEITVGGLSKAQGIETVITHLNIPQEQTIAIGDSMNDIEMIKYAGFGIAMGNAVDKIKEAADMITDDVNNAGVAKALTKIFSL